MATKYLVGIGWILTALFLALADSYGQGVTLTNLHLAVMLAFGVGHVLIFDGENDA